MKAGIISMLFPSEKHPAGGVFIKDELDHLSEKVTLKLMSPINIMHWMKYEHYYFTDKGYPVKRPFIFGIPRGIFHRYYPNSMAITLKIAGKNYFDDCDVIHAHLGFPDGPAAVLAYHGTKPVVVTVHGTDINSIALNKNLRPIMLETLNKAQNIICVSSSLADKVKNLGIYTNTTVIPNGIDTKIFRPMDKKECCMKLGLNPNVPRLLFAGNFVPVKGIPYLIEAFPEVLKSFPECELVLLGAVENNGDMIKFAPLIEKLGINEKVRIFPPVKHDIMSLWMNSSDIFVLPSIKEGFGLVAAESMACGKPVVSTFSGGPEDIVINGTGELVPPGDSISLSESIMKVLSGNGIMPGKDISAYASEKYSYDKVIEKIIDVYESVVY